MMMATMIKSNASVLLRHHLAGRLTGRLSNFLPYRVELSGTEPSGQRPAADTMRAGLSHIGPDVSAVKSDPTDPIERNRSAAAETPARIHTGETGSCPRRLR